MGVRQRRLLTAGRINEPDLCATHEAAMEGQDCAHLVSSSRRQPQCRAACSDHPVGSGSAAVC